MEQCKSWSERIRPQPMFDVLSMANDRESQGHYVARMEIGDTPGFRNEFIHDLISKHARSPLRYSPSRGEGLLISRIVETQWPESDENQIAVGPANFLITAAIASKTSPGDVILLPDPGFPTYKLAADFLGLKIIYYPVYSDEFPDLTKFVLQLKINPKVVVINNPSNPLGLAFSGKEISDSLRNFPDFGIEIILDETYINLIYDNTDAVIRDLPATRIRSFSKEFCAPGMRVGYVCSDYKSVETISNFMSLSISCIPKFIQTAVADFLGSKESTEFRNNVIATMKKRFEALNDLFGNDYIDVVPNSAFYALINTGDLSGDDVFRLLLDRNVATCPGSKFGQNSINTIRISLAGNSDFFENDLNMLSSGLKQILN